jgi:hypothetical protein
MHRKHRKELVKLAKETGEWDWSWLHDMVIMQIRHMYEYYTEDNCVWQTDETRLPIIEQLKHILDINAEIEQRDDNLGVEYIHKDGKCTIIYPDDFNERADRWLKKEQELYEELYSSIGKHLRWWWD